MIIKKTDASAKGVATLALLDRSGPTQLHQQTPQAPSSARPQAGPPRLEMSEPEARRTADRMLQQAQERSLTVEREAYEKGFAQGEKAGMELANKKAEALLQRYQASLAEFARLRGDILLRIEKDVVRLAVAIAKKIVHREVHADPEIILTMTRIALTRIGEKSMVTIHLNPADFKFVLDNKSRLGTASELAGITLVEDGAVSRGGCLIDTEMGSIDARVDEQLREIEHGLLGS